MFPGRSVSSRVSQDFHSCPPTPRELSSPPARKQVCPATLPASFNSSNRYFSVSGVFSGATHDTLTPASATPPRSPHKTVTEGVSAGNQDPLNQPAVVFSKYKVTGSCDPTIFETKQGLTADPRQAFDLSGRPAPRSATPEAGGPDHLVLGAQGTSYATLQRRGPAQLSTREGNSKIVSTNFQTRATYSVGRPDTTKHSFHSTHPPPPLTRPLATSTLLKKERQEEPGAAMKSAAACSAEPQEAFEFLQPSRDLAEPEPPAAFSRGISLNHQSLLPRSQTENYYVKSSEDFFTFTRPLQRRFVSPFARPGDCDALERQLQVHDQLSAQGSSVCGGISLSTGTAAEGQSTRWTDAAARAASVQEKAVTSSLRPASQPLAAQYTAHPDDTSGDQMARDFYSGSGSSASAVSRSQAVLLETQASSAEQRTESRWRANSTRPPVSGRGYIAAPESPRQQHQGQQQEQLQLAVFSNRNGEPLAESCGRFYDSGDGLARARGDERRLRCATAAGIRLSESSTVSPAASNYADSRISHDPVARELQQHQSDFTGDTQRRFPVREGTAATPRDTRAGPSTREAQQSYPSRATGGDTTAATRTHDNHGSQSGIMPAKDVATTGSAYGSGPGFCGSNTPFLSVRGPRAAAERAYFDMSRGTHVAGAADNDGEEIPRPQTQLPSGAVAAAAHRTFVEGSAPHPALAPAADAMTGGFQEKQKQHFLLGGSRSLRSSAVATEKTPEDTPLPQGESSNLSCSGDVHSSRGSRRHDRERSRGTRQQQPRAGRRSHHHHHRKGKNSSNSAAVDGPLISGLSGGTAHSAGGEESLHAPPQRRRGAESYGSSGGSHDSSGGSSSGNLLHLSSFQLPGRDRHAAGPAASSSFAGAGSVDTAPPLAARTHLATTAAAAGDSLQSQRLGLYTGEARPAAAAAELLPVVRDGSTRGGLTSYLDPGAAAIAARGEGEKHADVGVVPQGGTEEERSLFSLQGQGRLPTQTDLLQQQPHLPAPTGGATAHRFLHVQASQRMTTPAARERIQLLSGSFSPAPRAQDGEGSRAEARRDTGRESGRRQAVGAASAAALHSSSNNNRDGMSEGHANIYDSNREWHAGRRKSAVVQQQQQQEGQVLQYSTRSNAAALPRSHARLPTPEEGRLASLRRAAAEVARDEEEQEQQQRCPPAVFQQAAAAAAEPCLSPRMPSALLSEKERIGFDRTRSTSAGPASAAASSTYAAVVSNERSSSSRIRSNSSMSLLPRTLGERTAATAAATDARQHGGCAAPGQGTAATAAALPPQRYQLYQAEELSPTAAASTSATATGCDARRLAAAAAADTPLQRETAAVGRAGSGSRFVTATSTSDCSGVRKPTLLQQQQGQQQQLEQHPQLVQQQRPPLLLTEPSGKYASNVGGSGEREETGGGPAVTAGAAASERRAASAGASSAGSSRSAWYTAAGGYTGGTGLERGSSASLVCVCHASRAMARQKAQYEQQVRRLEEERQQHQQRMRLLGQQEEQQEQLQQQLQRQRERVMEEEEHLRVHREQLSQEQQEVSARWKQLEQQQMELGERKEKWRRLAQQKKEELQLVAAKLKAEKKAIDERKKAVEKEEAALKQRAESVERGEEKLSSERMKLQEQQLAVEREKTEAAEAAAAATAERLEACRRADEVARIEERLRQEEQQQQQRGQELQRQEQQLQLQEKAVQQQAAMQQQREEELTRRSKALEEQRAALEREEERLQQVAAAQQQQVQHRSSQLVAKEKELAHAQQRLTTAQQELDTARQQLQNRETEVLQQERDGEQRLRDMAEQLRKEREKQQQQMTEERALFEREVEEEKQRMDEERHRMQDMLQQQQTRWTEEKKKQEQTLEAEREHIKKMRAEVEVSQKAFDAEAASVRTLERSLAAQREELLELQQQLEKGEQQLKAREEQLEQELRAREQQLQQQGREQEAKLDELRQLAEQELREQKREQEEQVDEDRERVQQQQQNLDEERQRLQQLEQQLHEQKLKLQQELSSQVSKEERLFERERRVREQEQRLQREQQRLQHQQQQTEQQLRQQQEQQRDQEARGREREQQLQLREEELREREKKVVEVQRQIDQLHEEQTALSIDRSALEAEKESVERDRQILTEKLEYWTRQLSRREDEVKRREKQARLKLRDIETEQKVLRVRMQEDLGKVRPYKTAAASNPSPFAPPAPAAGRTQSQSPGPRLAAFQPPLMLGRSHRSTAAADDEEPPDPQEQRSLQRQQQNSLAAAAEEEGEGGGDTSPTGDSAVDVAVKEQSRGAAGGRPSSSKNSKEPGSVQLVAAGKDSSSRANGNSSSCGQPVRSVNGTAPLASKGSSDLLERKSAASGSLTAAPRGRGGTDATLLPVVRSASSPRNTELKPGSLQPWSAAAAGATASSATASSLSAVRGSSSSSLEKNSSPRARQLVSAALQAQRGAQAGGAAGSRLREGSLRSAAQQRQLLNSSTNSNASQRSSSQRSAFRRDRSKTRGVGGGWTEASSKSSRSPTAAGVDGRTQRRPGGTGAIYRTTRACSSSINRSSSSSSSNRGHAEEATGRAAGQLQEEETHSKNKFTAADPAEEEYGSHAAAGAAVTKQNSTYYNTARQQQRLNADETKKQHLSDGAPGEPAAAVSSEREAAGDSTRTHERDERGQERSHLLAQQRPRLSCGEPVGQQGGWGASEGAAASAAAQRETASVLRRLSSTAAASGAAAAAAPAGGERSLSFLQGGGGGELQAPPADPSALSPVSRRLPAAGGLSAASASRFHSSSNSAFPSPSSSSSSSSAFASSSGATLVLPPLAQQLREQRMGRRSADPGAAAASATSLQLHCTPYLDAEDDAADGGASSERLRAAGTPFLPCISGSSNDASAAAATAVNNATTTPRQQQQQQQPTRWISTSAASAATSPVERRQSNYANTNNGGVGLNNNATKGSSTLSLDGLRKTPRATENPDCSSSSSSAATGGGGAPAFDGSSRRSLSILRPRSAAAAPPLEKINDDTLLPASPPVRPHLEASARGTGPSKQEREALGCPRSSPPPALNGHAASPACPPASSSSASSTLLSRISSFLRRGGGRLSSAAGPAETPAAAEFHTPRGRRGRGEEGGVEGGGEAAAGLAGEGGSPRVAAAGQNSAAATEAPSQETEGTGEAAGASMWRRASAATLKPSVGMAHYQQPRQQQQRVSDSPAGGPLIGRGECGENLVQASVFGSVPAGEDHCRELDFGIKPLSPTQPRRSALDGNICGTQQQQQPLQKDSSQHFYVEPCSAEADSARDALLFEKEGKPNRKGELLQSEDTTTSSSIAAATTQAAVGAAAEDGALNVLFPAVSISQEGSEIPAPRLHSAAAGRGAASRRMGNSVLSRSPRKAGRTLCRASTEVAASTKLHSPADSAAAATDAETGKSGGTFIARESVISHLSAFNNEESDYGDLLLAAGGTLRGCN